MLGEHHRRAVQRLVHERRDRRPAGGGHVQHVGLRASARPRCARPSTASGRACAASTRSSARRRAGLRDALAEHLARARAGTRPSRAASGTRGARRRGCGGTRSTRRAPPSVSPSQPSRWRTSTAGQLGARALERRSRAPRGSVLRPHLDRARPRARAAAARRAARACRAERRSAGPASRTRPARSTQQVAPRAHAADRRTGTCPRCVSRIRGRVPAARAGAARGDAAGCELEQRQRTAPRSRSGGSDQCRRRAPRRPRLVGAGSRPPPSARSRASNATIARSISLADLQQRLADHQALDEHAASSRRRRSASSAPRPTASARGRAGRRCPAPGARPPSGGRSPRAAARARPEARPARSRRPLPGRPPGGGRSAPCGDRGSSCRRGGVRLGSLDRHRLCEVARLVDVVAAQPRDPVGEQLQGDDRDDRLQQRVRRGTRT